MTSRFYPLYQALFIYRLLFLEYSRVHISSDEVFSKIPTKPSIVQKKMIPHMKAFGLFNKMKQKKISFEKRNSKWPPKKRSFSSSANSQYFLAKISWIGSLISKNTNNALFAMITINNPCEEGFRQTEFNP